MTEKIDNPTDWEMPVAVLEFADKGSSTTDTLDCRVSVKTWELRGVWLFPNLKEAKRAVSGGLAHFKIIDTHRYQVTTTFDGTNPHQH